MAEKKVNKLSVCRVQSSIFDAVNNDKSLQRLFDIKDDTLKKPQYNDQLPATFENRKWLFKNDGPDELEYIGVWQWDAIPNQSDSSKDYVRSSFEPDIKPILIKVIDKIKSTDDLIAALHNGVDTGIKRPDRQSLMFLYKNREGEYSGLYCPEGTLFDCGNKIGMLNDDVSKLDEVYVYPEDILYSVGYQFYCYTDVDPIKTVTTEPIERIVKKCILDRTTWPAFSNFVGGTHSELKLFKDFLSEATNSVEEDIADKAGCDINTASKYVNSFLSNVNTYLSGSDVESKMMVALVESNAELREQYEKLISEKWYENNKKELSEKIKELDKVNSELEFVREDLAKQKEAFEKEKKAFNNWSESTKKYKASFGSEIAQMAKDAKENFTKVLADSVYLNSLIFGNNEVTDNSSTKVDRYKTGNILNTEEKHDTYEDVFDLLEDNLVSAGVDTLNVDCLAAFLLSAVINRKPIILAGPNGRAIADALSASLYTSTAGYIKYNKSDNTAVLKQIAESSDKVVCIDGFNCNYEFANEIPDIIGNCEKMLIFTTPYSEDLYIEPEGLYNYALPILTDLFVLNEPSFNWIGGEAGGSWLIIPSDHSKNRFEVLSKIIRNPLTANTYEIVLSDASVICGKVPKDGLLSYLTAYVPYAVATRKNNRLADIIEDENNMDSDDIEFMLTFLKD